MLKAVLNDEGVMIPPEIQMAQKFREERRPDEALKYVNKYLDDHFEDVPSLITAAQILMESNRIGMAQALFKLAAILRPESSHVWSDLGLCYREGADLEEGEKCFIKALTRDPNNTFALVSSASRRRYSSTYNLQQKRS